MLQFPEDAKMQSLYEGVVKAFGEFPQRKPAPKTRYFSELVESIIGQQLSGKVADVITAKVKKTLPGGKITPEAIKKVRTETLRKAGPSYSKVSYMKNIATAWLDGTIKHKQFAELGNEEIAKELIQIKGIGMWTAEMFLMFTLGRTDVFSPGDYALRKAMIRLYKLPEKVKPDKLIKLSNKWSPNRSLACRVLWSSLELPVK
jgi:DNA-3-methyladenine glycosylase II